MLAEEGGLSHIISNLVRNAHQADDSGRAIEVSVMESNATCWLSVRDRGPDFDAAIAEGAFEL